MNPVQFPQANTRFGPPEDLEESQCRNIHAFAGEIRGGSIDGSLIVITAWKPTEEEIEQLKRGGYVYLTVIGGLPPHCLTTDFKSAINIQ